MRQRVAAVAALALLATLAGPAPAGAGPAAGGPGSHRELALRPPAQLLGGDTVPGVLLVTTSGRAATDALTRAAGTTVPAAAAAAVGTRVARVTVPRGSERAAAAALAARPGVLAVEPARYRRLLRTPDDPLYPQQWAHRLANAEQAWSSTVGAASVTVAVIDNGVDARHPDLRGNVQAQRVVVGGSSSTVPLGSDNRQCDAYSGGDHGTHVAGIVGAEGDDGTGVAGVAWDVGLLDYAVFAFGENGCAASDADVLAAIAEATEADADVVNLSLGGATPEAACSTAFQTVIDEARAAGTVVVAAAGNSEETAPGQPSVPASCNGAISVGAVTVDGTHAPYSTTNEHVDLAAPGGDSRTGFADGILSTIGDANHDSIEGTSMAAPYVSGVAALLRAVAPELTPDEVEGLLEATGRDAGPEGRDAAYGWGLVDAGAAVEATLRGARPAPEPDPVFPVSDDGGSGLEPPPPGGPEVYRVAPGTGWTSAVPQAVAMSQSTYPDAAAAHAVLARADDYPDALAGSSLTLGSGPLLFSGRTGPLPAPTRDELLRVLERGSTVYLLGGEAALPTALESELRQLGFNPVRLAGRNREETAVAVADELAARRAALGRPDPGLVLLTTSANWPDAVSAGSLGAAYGIPILVTPAASLHAAPAALLGRLRPDELLVVGGATAISDATAAAAGRAAGTGSERTSRVAGRDRYETSVAVARVYEGLLAREGLPPGCVVAVNLVRGDGFAHALSANSLAGAYGCVMVPVEGPTGDRLPEVTRAYVHRMGVDGVLAGDVDVISDDAAWDLYALLQA